RHSGSAKETTFMDRAGLGSSAGRRLTQAAQEGPGAESAAPLEERSDVELHQLVLRGREAELAAPQGPSAPDRPPQASRGRQASEALHRRHWRKLIRYVERKVLRTPELRDLAPEAADMAMCQLAFLTRVDPEATDLGGYLRRCAFCRARDLARKFLGLRKNK